MVMCSFFLFFLIEESEDEVMVENSLQKQQAAAALLRHCKWVLITLSHTISRKLPSTEINYVFKKYVK